MLFFIITIVQLNWYFYSDYKYDNILPSVIFNLFFHKCLFLIQNLTIKIFFFYNMLQ